MYVPAYITIQCTLFVHMLKVCVIFYEFMSCDLFHFIVSLV